MFRHEDKKKPIALSFFSGAMGLDIGLEKAGFEIILCSEFDNACRKTIKKNKPDITLIGDIREYTSKDILKKAHLSKGDEIDLIVGGPPCQAFSTAGRRKSFDDKRGNVLLIYLELIFKLKPRYVVIENVRGILSASLKHLPYVKGGFKNTPLIVKEQKGGVLFYIITKLKDEGYSVSFNLYNSANFGTPQKRERVIIICSRDGYKMPYLVPSNSEKGEFGLPKWVTFKEATCDLITVEHHYLNFPEKRIKYYKMLKPGQNWKDLPEHLQKEALGKAFFTGGGKTGFLRRLFWDKPSPTLVTHPAMPATDLAHPLKNRPLSIEEYKRIQEFPDNWQIEGNLVEQYRQLGNAVPISLGKAIGALIIAHRKHQKIEKFLNFPYSRYKNTDDISWLNEFDLHRMSLLPLRNI